MISPRNRQASIADERRRRAQTATGPRRARCGVSEPRPVSRCVPGRTCGRRHAGSAARPSCPTCAISSRSFSTLLTGVRFTATITSPGCTPAFAAGPADVLDDHAAIDAADPGVLVRRSADARRHRACPGAATSLAPRESLRSHRARPLRPRASAPAVAPHLERRPSCPARRRDHRRQRVRALDGLAVVLEDHVAGLESRARGRAALLHRSHQRAARPSRPKLSAMAWSTGWTLTPSRPCETLPCCWICSLTLQRHVDRDREGQALEAAAAAEDLRVDADHLALEVEQRAAGVAGIDGRVGLDERHGGIAGQRARLRADDARVTVLSRP